ncbi:hypothetical protein [Snuella sedimenti]|uniref:Uncharacterized protein n=1 Tax=Snuella sedimenti TaxID=2798802 RepID=A0A8J7JCZ3_9FLAO|nr:hypothetical protein [Snuella sedimenti]MBJ6368674.1 hypothetical protein [Snuella sedimenti]
MKKKVVVLVVVVLAFGLKINAQESIKNFKGTWEYVCNEAPYGYNSGSIIVGQEKDRPTVKVVYEDGSENTAESVKVKNGVLYFNMSVEDSFIKVQLQKDGTKIKGKAINNYGEELGITAVKKK